jgi:hypothetical protein
MRVVDDLCRLDDRGQQRQISRNRDCICHRCSLMLNGEDASTSRPL